MSILQFDFLLKEIAEKNHSYDRDRRACIVAELHAGLGSILNTCIRNTKR